MKRINIVLALVVLLFTQHVYGAIESYNERLEGSAITGGVFHVYDDKYFDMLANPNWDDDYRNQNVLNTVQLGINPEVLQTTTYTTGFIRVQVDYEYWNTGTSSFAWGTAITDTLFVSYDASSGTALIDDLSTLTFEDGHHLKVTVLEVSNLTVANLYLEAAIIVDRVYIFDGAAVSGASYQVVGNDNDYIRFSWAPKDGAESYELEWVHINDYKVSSGQYYATTDLNYNYYLNSTRINISEHFYEIPKVFDHGYLLFRVRAIGKQGNKFQHNYFGSWTSSESGLVSAHSSAQRYFITTEYDSLMNWSHQVGYVEEGKRMEAISFRDGLGRGRQSVAHNTVTEQAIVSNVYYDEIGRPVISDLPTPVEDEELKHYPDFNRADTTGYPSYNLNYFDVPPTDTCDIPSSLAFADTTGAGKYYSTNNDDTDAENAYIPDAEGFPFTRIKYKDDFTGRVNMTSGAGEEFIIGSGHETRFVYPSPDENELNRLFGSEVGDFTHYTKMITIDPNGQVYAQYTDMAGRVVASYMLGPSPLNLDSLADTASDSVVFELINGQLADLGSAVPMTTFDHAFFIAEDNETYTFSYAFTPQEYENACLGATICFDCMYDVDLQLTDDCGIAFWDTTFQVNGSTFDEMCASLGEQSYSTAVVLPQGVYYMHKQLAVSQSAIDEYWCAYLDNDTCSMSLPDFFNLYYNEESFYACEEENVYMPLDPDSLGICGIHEQVMLYDVSPGGQYALFEDSSGVFTSSDVTSIFYSNAWEDVAYFDANGDTIFVQNTAGQMVEPNELTSNEFISLFDPVWANALIQEHLEYCFLEFCEDNGDSHEYDLAMLNTYDFDSACVIGYTAPMGHGSTIDPFTSCDTTNLDPFFDTGGGGINYTSSMEDTMANYLTIESSTYTMWEAAVLSVMCPDDTTSSAADACLSNYDSSGADSCQLDLIWIAFREFYQGPKSSYYYLAQHDYASVNNCANACVSSSASGCEDYMYKVSRFGNVETMFGMDIYATPDSLQTASDTLFGNTCVSLCEAYADDWLEALDSCDFSSLDSTDMANLWQDMVDLCSFGCNDEHPVGASTTPTGDTTANGHSNIDDILTEYLGAGYEDEWCTELLISLPGPYVEIDAMTGQLTANLDTCGCNAIYEAQYDLVNNNPLNFGSLEEMLAFNTGIAMSDVHFLMCACDGLITGSWEDGPGSYVWRIDANSSLASYGYDIPVSLTCQNEGCVIDCAVISAEMDTLDTRFSGVTDFEETQAYSDILTNYLNHKYNYHLWYEDYLHFINSCNATSQDPYCRTSDAAVELPSVLNLLAYRGQLTNTSADQVNLQLENVVYANGILQDEFSDHDYWSSEADSSLTLYLDSGDCTIKLTAWDEFDFTSIVDFGEIQPVTESCSVSNKSFTIPIKYIDCGQLQMGELSGVSLCFSTNICVCDTAGLILCDDWQMPEEDPCYEPYLTEMYYNGMNDWQASIDSTYADFTTDYNDQCAAAFATESLEYAGKIRTYQFTLFYYDQAGNLVKTIAPEGIELGYSSSNSTINAARESITSSASVGAADIPDHDYTTTYAYNSYNQLVETTNPDQDGDTKFWYDRYGRISASQNPVQATENKYSYSKYDPYGRPIEVGQTVRVTAPTESDLKTDDKGVLFEVWVDAGSRTEVTVTTYDEELSVTIAAKFKSGDQQNLRLRVATVAYFVSFTGSTNDTTDYESAIHYSYDIHGNVIETLQDVPMMSPVDQDIKSTQYTFELLSGNVETVRYQEDENDFFEHSYDYDRLNRLRNVYTSTDDVHSTHEANYRYYDYGPLARTELGEYQVQGCDFNFTINGWLKGMNSSTLDASRDMGKDGNSGFMALNDDVHTLFGEDVAAYTIGYFNGDYSAIGTSSMEASYDGSDFDSGSAGLYNGNIRHTVTSIYGMTTLGATYTYDQLQRLKSMTAYENTNVANDWDGISSTTDYYNAYEYDKNGNITSLTRNATSALGLYMDAFEYHYVGLDGNPNSSSTSRSNRLNWVDDTGANDGIAGDITSSMNSGNYVYDEIGELIEDSDEGISAIYWRRGDKKILKIVRDDASSSQLEFIYNPFGQRVIKIEKPRSGGTIVATNLWIYTFYSYDANGQVMGVYDARMSAIDNRAWLDELNIYGSSRLGQYRSSELLWDDGAIAEVTDSVYQNTLGQRYYEITNHLGNVLAVINDRKMVVSGEYEAVVINTSDYYPFGMVMPGRNTTSDSYRYAYNGMEQDGEVSGDGNSYDFGARNYDPRICRFTRRDDFYSYFPSESPYMYAGNSPLMYVDYNGDFKIIILSEATNNKGAAISTKRVEAIINDLGNYLRENPRILDEIINQTMREGGDREAMKRKILNDFEPGEGPEIRIGMSNTFAAHGNIDVYGEMYILVDYTLIDFMEETWYEDDIMNLALNLIFGGTIIHEYTHSGDAKLNGRITSGDMDDMGKQNTRSKFSHRGTDPEVQMHRVRPRTDVTNLDTGELEGGGFSYSQNQIRFGKWNYVLEDIRKVANRISPFFKKNVPNDKKSVLPKDQVSKPKY
ncbi:MAG: RHS repeat-associated core domain-containing protein [Crocinitomicaceae bacterium]|nr:RHS repeat-associated core domain-containing protein [Crocinitomicaceae bacterium]